MLLRSLMAYEFRWSSVMQPSELWRLLARDDGNVNSYLWLK